MKKQDFVWVWARVIGTACGMTTLLTLLIWSSVPFWDVLGYAFMAFAAGTIGFRYVLARLVVWHARHPLKITR